MILSPIEKMLESYPAFLTSAHLVELGIYSCIDSAYHARTNKCSPAWIKLKHKIVYAKCDVIEFLENRKR